MSHIYAFLEVPEEVWQEIMDRLTVAGHGDVERDGEIDMHGFALVKDPGEREQARKDFFTGELERE